MVRFKNRWVLIEVQGEPVLSKTDGEYENAHIASLNGGTIHTAVRDAILANYGEYGLGSLLSSFNGKPQHGSAPIIGSKKSVLLNFTN
jgi:hypothetical protein